MPTSRFAVVVSVVCMYTFMFGIGIAIACTEAQATAECEDICDWGCDGAECLKVTGKEGKNPWYAYCDAKSCSQITNPSEINCVSG